MTADLYVLDTSPLGLVTNPRESQDGRRCKVWLSRALSEGARVLIPDVVDYEVRRELLRAGKTKGLGRLDALIAQLDRVSIDLRVWHLAAELWAGARRQGRPTASEAALDADLLIAAVARLAAEDGSRVAVVTDNVGHLSRFVDARDWRTLGEVSEPAH